jgi:hypothetical protein
MQHKIDTDIPYKTPREIDRQYNGSYEEYEDAADYIDVRGALKGRVIA